MWYNKNYNDSNREIIVSLIVFFNIKGGYSMNLKTVIKFIPLAGIALLLRKRKTYDEIYKAIQKCIKEEIDAGLLCKHS